MLTSKFDKLISNNEYDDIIRQLLTWTMEYKSVMYMLRYSLIPNVTIKFFAMYTSTGMKLNASTKSCLYKMVTKQAKNRALK